MLNVVRHGRLITVCGLTAEGVKLAKESLYGVIKVTEKNGFFNLKALGIKDAFKSKVKVRLV